MSTIGILGTLLIVVIVSSRYLVLRALKQAAPEFYHLTLGAPTFNQLWGNALESRARSELRSRFNSFIWRREFLGVGAPSVKVFGALVMASDVAAVVMVCWLIYLRVNDG
jgi:hypothetical protein